MSDYMTLVIWNTCNQSCQHCMIEGSIKNDPPMGFARYKVAIDQLVAVKKHTKLILSGAEVTLCSELLEYIYYASGKKYFTEIQLQTNALKLVDTVFMQAIVAAGVTEFFISVPGIRTAKMLTRNPEQGEMIFSIIESIKKNTAAKVITNTVVTTINLGEIKETMKRLISLKVDGLMIWNYWPMAETDKLNLLVSLKDWHIVQQEINTLLLGTSIPLYLRGFPICLLPHDTRYVQDDCFPDTLASEKLWGKVRLNKYTCTDKQRCRLKNCEGVAVAYTNKFGRCVFVPYT